MHQLHSPLSYNQSNLLSIQNQRPHKHLLSHTSTHGAHIRQTKLNESRRKHSNLRKNKRTIVREQKNKRRTQEQRKTPNREQIIKNKAGKRRFQNHQRTQVLK